MTSRPRAPSRASASEIASRTLGAGEATTFLRVAIPSAMPGLVAGLALAWGRALGEFGATITFAGNLPGVTQTLPLAVYIAMETRPEVAIILSLVLLLVSLAVLVALAAARGRLQTREIRREIAVLRDERPHALLAKGAEATALSEVETCGEG